VPDTALFLGGHLFAKNRRHDELGQAVHQGSLGGQVGFGEHAAVGLLFAYGAQVAGQDGLAGHPADRFCQGAGVFEALGAGHRVLGGWRHGDHGVYGRARVGLKRRMRRHGRGGLRFNPVE
jgi:hypothetical protein